MIYISAGHHLKQPKPDPGAVAKHGGKLFKESELAILLREKVCGILAGHGVKYITDKDTETLAEYISRIRPGAGSVVCEIHLNAATNISASGTETLVKTAPSTTEWDMAKALSDGTAQILGIPNRGVKTEAQSHRGRLGILNTAAGISALTEVCFISNANDVAVFLAQIDELAEMYASVLTEYEKKFS